MNEACYVCEMSAAEKGKKEGKILDFFPPSSQKKRTRPVLSSDSDSSFSTQSPECKRLSTMAEVSLEELVRELNNKINNLATKEDVCGIKTQMLEIVNKLDGRMEVLEGRMLEEEAKTAKIEKDVKVVQGKNARFQSNLQEHDNRIRTLEKEHNDAQQYSRRWNLRVYKVPETSDTEDCEKKICDIFTDLVGVKTTHEDIEVAHRTGKRSSQAPRPILVRFANRKKRDAVLAARRNLKGKGYVVDEDLTPLNYALSKKASKHSATMAVWSTNGKILAKLKTGKIVKLDIHSDVDKELNEQM